MGLQSESTVGDDTFGIGHVFAIFHNLANTSV